MSEETNSIRVAERMRRAMNLIVKVARAVAGEMQSEILRLNCARLDSAMLARTPRRERARLVKSALIDHHRHPNRCC